MASETMESAEISSQEISSSSSDTAAGIENPNWQSTLRITHPALLAAAQYNPSRLLASAPVEVLGEVPPNLGSTENLGSSRDSGSGQDLESTADVEVPAEPESPADLEPPPVDIGSSADMDCSVASEYGVEDLSDVTPRGNFHYGAEWTSKQAMESFRIKERPVFGLIAIFSGSSAGAEGDVLEDEQSTPRGKDLVRLINIEMMLKGAWNTQFSKASCFVSARVEEVGLPGHADFIPKFLNFERRCICVRWSCFVAVEVVSAWQRGEIGYSGGFYSKKESKRYNIDAASDDGLKHSNRLNGGNTLENSNGSSGADGFHDDGGVGDTFGFNENNTPAERVMSVDRYIDYYHLT